MRITNYAVKITNQELKMMEELIIGDAVYKARTLYATTSPGVEFNDLTICNNAGVYKGGKSVFEEENEYLNSLIKKEQEKAITITDTNKFMIHPNPAQNQLNISYNIEQDGLCIIYDILGNEKQRLFLPKNTSRVSITLNSFIPGIYTCKFIEDNKYLETHKLIID